jgi:Cu/Ag efflux pump CusA
MPEDVVPELASGPVLEVQTEALGLASQEVEQYVTVPMENNLLDGIMGVWDERSQSIPGLSTVDLYFEPGTTVLHARQLVTERLTNAFSLPNISKPPLLIQPLSSSSRALMIGLRSSSLNPLELSYLARWVIKPRLSGVPGVANVAIFGQRDQQIQVLVDPSQLAARRVTLNQIISTAGNAQLVSPLTYLQGSSPGTGGFLDGPNQRLEVRPVLPLAAPRNLASVPVSGAPNGVRLGDVSTVVQGHQPLIGDAVVGGGSGLVLLVQKLPSASVRGVTNGVEQALDGLRPALQGVTIDTSFFRPASYITSARDNLGLALLIAAGLALVALAALMVGARAVVITAIAMALSLVAAALLLQLFGYSLNALVVVGLLIASAIIVDDAVGATVPIVQRLRDPASDLPVRAAVLEIFGELRSTLGYATLFVLLCVAPVFFSKGLTATFLHPLVLSFALAVIASMVVALTFTPALAYLFYDRGRTRHRTAALGARIGNAYRLVVGVMLGIPRWAIASLCLAGLVAAVAIPFLKEPSAPTFRDRNLVVQWDGPAGASLTEMDRITQRTVVALRALPSVADAAAILGRAVSGDQIVDTSSGQILVSIKPSADYDNALAAITAIVQGTPGMQASVSTYESDVISGVLAPAPNNIAVRVYGEDYGQLGALAGQVQGLMDRVRGLGPAQVQLPAQEPNIQVAVNDAAALRAGVLPGDARRQASTLVSGLVVGNFFERQAVFDVVVQGAASVRSSLDSVRGLLIDTAGGGHVRLSQIASVTVQPDPIDIQHEALSRYVDVSAPVYAGSVSGEQAQIQSALGHIQFPLAYHAEILGGTPETPTSHFVFVSYVLAAIVGMLLLAQAAFSSWRLAAVFMLTLPLALAGGVIVALATGQVRSLGSDAGLLALFALAARQGMLLIAHIRRLHARDGGALTPQIVTRAAAERLAPSLATLVVTAAVMVPFVAMGDVAGNEITRVAAAVILGGLLSTALLTQVLLPAVCFALGPTGAVVTEDEPPLATAGEPPAETVNGQHPETVNGQLPEIVNGRPPESVDGHQASIPGPTAW